MPVGSTSSKLAVFHFLSLLQGGPAFAAAFEFRELQLAGPPWRSQHADGPGRGLFQRPRPRREIAERARHAQVHRFALQETFP